MGGREDRYGGSARAVAAEARLSIAIRVDGLKNMVRLNGSVRTESMHPLENVWSWHLQVMQISNV